LSEIKFLEYELWFRDSLALRDVPSGTEMSEAPLIAIVDDDALARDGVRELVGSLGYETVTFSSAQDFLASSVITKTTS
jgi:hypothetical protein